jgi:hypothetical protein
VRFKVGMEMTSQQNFSQQRHRTEAVSPSFDAKQHSEHNRSLFPHFYTETTQKDQPNKNKNSFFQLFHSYISMLEVNGFSPLHATSCRPYNASGERRGPHPTSCSQQQ